MTIAFLIFLASSFLYSANQVTVEAAHLPSQLKEAENALKQAFAALLEAEQEGANVTDLLSRFNDGANLLAQAEMAYRVGNISGVIDKAGSVYTTASGVETDAIYARNTALINNQNNVWSIAAIYDVTGFSFISVMFLIWRWFRQNYIKRLRDSKPEVKTNEA